LDSLNSDDSAKVAVLQDDSAKVAVLQDDSAKAAVLQDDPDSSPLRNVLREAARFSPSGRFDGIGTTRTRRPPKPVAISVKNALDRLSKAFAPKHTHQPAGAEQPSSSDAEQPSSSDAGQ
jgi:hypothetical protein